MNMTIMSAKVHMFIGYSLINNDMWQPQETHYNGVGAFCTRYENKYGYRECIFDSLVLSEGNISFCGAGREPSS